MMKSIIQALYNGNPAPSDAGFEHNVNYDDVLEKISEITDYLKTKLDVDEHKIFLDLEALQSKITTAEADKSFKHGFCIAALLMIEIFTAENLIS